MSSNWRARAQAIIRDVEQEQRGRPYASLKRALKEAYPWGARENHPYKMWCREQALALARHPDSPQKQLDGLPLFADGEKGQ